MCCHKRIDILREGSDEVIFRVKIKQAMAILAEGFAEIVDSRSIRITKNSGLVMARSSDSLTASTQERTYESAATDKHPRFFNGGLCRTEHRPAKIPKYTGARVGHQ